MISNFYNFYDKNSKINKFKKNVFLISLVYFVLYYAILCNISIKIYFNTNFFSIACFFIIFILIICTYISLLCIYYKDINLKNIFKIKKNLNNIIYNLKIKKKNLVKNSLKKYNLYTKEKIKHILNSRNDYNNINIKDNTKAIKIVSFETFISIIISLITLYYTLILSNNAEIKFTSNEASIIISLIIVVIIITLIIKVAITSLKQMLFEYKNIDYDILYIILDDIYVELLK